LHNHRERLGYDDLTRADIALREVVGKRLTYETARSLSAAGAGF
jgi:hypothetical protein